MGRAGAGRSGGGSRSHSSHSVSRSSSSHHVSSGGSRRAGSGSNFSSRRSSNYGGGGIHINVGRSYGRYSYGSPSYDNMGSYHYERNVGGAGGKFISILIIFIIMIGIILTLSKVLGGFSDSVPKSTVNRDKLDTGVVWRNDCVVDEIGWFDNISRTEKELQYFYEQTGVQPYIVLLDYMPQLTSDAAREAYAEQWYDEHIDNEGTFLFMYFAEYDVDNDVGAMVATNGIEVSSVMDAEATDIFWAYIDRYWYSDMSTDDMFVSVFTKTADRIMDKSTTGADVGKVFVIFLIVVAVIVGVIVFIVIRRKHEKERNEETERILSTPLEKAGDSVLDKYEDN